MALHKHLVNGPQWEFSVLFYNCFLSTKSRDLEI